MKCIGLLGGMSWESSLLYYKIINEETNRILGSQNNAKSVMTTVNFEEIEQLQSTGRWDEATDILLYHCKLLEEAKVDFIVLCTNTMHKLLPNIMPHIKTPFLHIAKATAIKIKEEKVTSVLLLGTKFTMQEDFYKHILQEEGIDVCIPNESDMETVHSIIYNELCLGKIDTISKQRYLDIITNFLDIEGVILGCTEIGLLISQEDLDIKVFDTTQIHAKKAVELALS